MAFLCLFACTPKQAETTLSGLKQADFVSQIDSKPTALYVLTNNKGVEVCVTNYGGHLVSFMAPDRKGKMTDVLLGYDNIADYAREGSINYGAFIGRYGNRIANASFTLDGETYKLEANNGTNCLHGGFKGFDRKVLDAKQLASNSIEMTYLSPDNDSGFPGNLKIKLTYTLTDDNALHLVYEATTDKPTVCNLTNHSYFNISGVAGSTVLDQELMINADQYTEVDSIMIPTGEILDVEGTPLDLRQAKSIGENINSAFNQIAYGNGYDNNWVLNTKTDVSTVAATVYCPTNGMLLEVYTNEPGLQVYTGNAMKGNDVGKFGVTYPIHGAVCLESQHYPDSPHQPSFPSTVLRPGETYHSECVYKLSVK
ncbi:MAG: galactose mutarotase [Massilibacteroides sp.]|nr:galactose mutarotase [Massilibacteroides sp.]